MKDSDTQQHFEIGHSLSKISNLLQKRCKYRKYVYPIGHVRHYPSEKREKQRSGLLNVYDVI